MNDYTGTIRLFAFGFIPRDYMLCDGRRLKIKENLFLHHLIGDTYGPSDGKTFALPDLRDKAVVHPSTDLPLGGSKGNGTTAISEEQMPLHNHDVKLQASDTSDGELLSPVHAILNNNAGGFSATPSPNAALGDTPVAEVGQSAPFSTKNAYVKMVYAICVKNGIIPSS